MNTENPAQSAVSRQIWEAKYRFDGEKSITASWHRVANALAAVEANNQDEWATAFAGLLNGYRFLPGGRILAGAGTGRDVTLFNCFVMGDIEDSMPGIFDALKAGAMTMQQGGGIGYDFSPLRPAGSATDSTGGIASGPVSFMRVWDSMCATMLSTGARRGAMMATLRCDHPDIETFIDAKRDPRELRNFNLSVQVTGAFLDAMRADRDWPLRFPVGDGEVLRSVSARDLWQRLMRAAYDVAEPGVLFVDQINRTNNLWYCEELAATNPCGEVPLPAYGACNLGSLNLAQFVTQPFTADAALDLDAVQAAAGLAVRFLDNVIDASRYPLPEQADAARGSRRIGLGITGLADALVMLGHSYASPTGLDTAALAMRTICHAAYAASIELAKERKPFTQFDRDKYLQGRFIEQLPDELQQGIRDHGIRNSHLLAIAPAGTISLLANNVSSGIEPIFALEFERRILRPDGTRQEITVRDHAWELWQALRPGEPAPPEFVAAAEIAPATHLAMQAALQPFVDSAISKTINVAADCSFEQFSSIYSQAYELALKGCTVFRPNPVRSEVLSVTPSHCCDIDREAD
ncbi:MAG: adenosylcobalamin-dependent ribonucleoside-diphosphate reductase [Gammaproteobacteria bacterium]|nr:adenosylcobalamin-dependent ribonucleoside-diphosphate reductase [Gammaproteobacteria bacterium]